MHFEYKHKWVKAMKKYRSYFNTNQKKKNKKNPLEGYINNKKSTFWDGGGGKESSFVMIKRSVHHEGQQSQVFMHLITKLQNT